MSRNKIVKEEILPLPERQLFSDEDQEIIEEYARTTKVDSFFAKMKRLAQSNSLQCFPFINSCCLQEFDSACGPKYHFEKFCSEINYHSPRQSDLLIIGGMITEKQLPILLNIYEQMASPKWVIAMGACAISGGLYDSYSVIQGISKYIPVDIYIPGCPPTSEAIIQAIFQLKEKIKRARVAKIRQEDQ